jgi:NAD(P)-dependent dehydrogenase (short-subunit alcohol dehydrogenase family)
MRLEYPAIHFTAVTGWTPFEADTFADRAANEVSDPATYPEVAYDGASRLRPVTEAQPLESATEGWCPDGSSVVVGLGGAQGISPAVLTALSQRWPGHFVLVGRSARDEQLANRYAGLPTRQDVQKHLIEVEQIAHAKDVAARLSLIMKARSIEEALAQVATTGATVEYMQVDVRDDAALGEAFDAIRAKHGRIDVVFHAAGTVEDKLFQGKSWASFERVFSTKTAPLPRLASLVGEVKLIVFFASMVGVFGNTGQCDYAAANCVLDQTAVVLAARQSATRLLSIAWGPWKGVGMVSSGLEAEMRKRGLSLFDLDSGSNFCCDEIKFGDEPNVIGLPGDTESVMAYLASFTTAPFQVAER